MKFRSFRLTSVFVSFAIVFLVGLAVYFVGIGIIRAQDKSDETRNEEAQLPTEQAFGRADYDDDCSTRGPSVRLPATKLIIEHNSTAEDTGVHGFFDGIYWRKLCV